MRDPSCDAMPWHAMRRHETSPQTWEPAPSHYSWQMQCHRHSPAPPVTHGPLDTSQVMELTAGPHSHSVVLSDDTIFRTREMHYIVLLCLFTD